MPDFPAEVVLTCTFIILARICDVTLGTIRTVAVVQGRRWLSWILGFFEVLIWVVVVSKVVTSLQNPVYAVCYAFGFAAGNFIGVTIEGRLAFGYQAVRVFTHLGVRMAETLRSDGFPVTQFEGTGKDGPVWMLFMESRRKDSPRITKIARELDPSCFYIVDDIRYASSSPKTGTPSTRAAWWDGLIKRK